MTVLHPTQQQYNELNGWSSPPAQLSFVKDGLNRWIVSERVLTDPHFAPIHPQLSELERIDYVPPVPDDEIL